MLRENLQKIQETIEAAALQAGRTPNEITLLGATKGVPPDRIQEAARLGVRVFGENRVQEAQQKIPLVRVPGIVWHMIGHLQRNKAKHAVRLFQMIQSVDSLKLAQELQKRLVEGQTLEILLEVNTSGEPTKHGLPPRDEEVFRLAEQILGCCPGLRLRGLMTLGPYPPEERRSRQSFARLRELRDHLEAHLGVNLPILSMGMSEDYVWAILEGATMIRLGRALFGPREA